MKSFYFCTMALSALAILVGGTAAQAGLLWQVTFDEPGYVAAPAITTTYTGSGPLIGQASTANPANTWHLYSEFTSNTTYQNSGCFPAKGMELIDNDIGVNTTNMVKHILNYGNSIGFAGAWQNIGPFTFTAADTHVEQYGWMTNTTNWNGSMRFGLLFQDQPILQYSGGHGVIGILSGKATWVSRGGIGDVTTYSGANTLTVGHWYEFRGDMDFSVLGGQITVSYRDVTDNTDWVTETSLTNLPMGIAPVYVNSEPTYVVTGIGIMSQRSAYTMYYDNFKLVAGVIPEPSTLVLLVGGLVGLLAYAWRKRK
jgi:hypothetical protein